MANVILFRPPECYSLDLSTRRCPLGLLYLAAPLREQGYSVQIIDSQTCPDWQAALAQALDAETICVGASVMTGYPIKGALEFAAAAKALGSGRSVPVVFGGLHPSFYFRTRLGALTKGLWLYNLDARTFRLAKRVLRLAA
ncbi:MAG: cobalamin-dependent protein [Phycisphaeraceae bacterium]